MNRWKIDDLAFIGGRRSFRQTSHTYRCFDRKLSEQFQTSRDSKIKIVLFGSVTNKWSVKLLLLHIRDTDR